MLPFDEYRKYDALGLAELVQKGSVSPEELLETAISAAESINPSINAIVHKLYEQGRLAAKTIDKNAVFAGVPFLVKDLGLDVKGAPICIGSKGYKDQVSQYDSFLTEKIRRAGLMIFGKTNTPEFGLTPYTEPEFFGPARNPHNLEHSPGGSSGGSAASVAAGIVPIATANDGGGSIRIPASCCGLFGMKPSRGRTSWAPKGEMWSGAAVEGCVSKTVRDTAAYLDMLIGGAASDPYLFEKPVRSFLSEVGAATGKLRIAYSREHTFGKAVSQDCLDALDKAIDLLKQEGHDLQEIPLPYKIEDLTKAFIIVVSAETSADIRQMGDYLQRNARPSDVEANTYAFKLLGDSFTASEYAYAKRKWAEIALRLAQIHNEYDLFLTPTLARPPLKIGALKNPPMEEFLVRMINRFKLGGLAKASIHQLAEKIYDYMPWTVFANISGQPSMSFPIHRNAGNLPIGVMFTARMGAEDLLFRLAGQLEKAV